MPKKGRPKQAMNRDYDQSDAVPSRCMRCQSTERSEYTTKQQMPLQNTHINPTDGQPYNMIIFRPCQCLKCLQWRKDRSYELVEQPETGI